MHKTVYLYNKRRILSIFRSIL